MSYSLKLIKDMSDEKSNLEFIKMMNNFRDEYFQNKSPFKFETKHLHRVLYERKDVICGFITNNKHNIGVFESTVGTLGDMPCVSLATIYIRNKHRKKNVSKEFYDLSFKLFEEKNMAWCCHIEESKFIGNERKFKQLGFTHYIVIDEFIGDSQYKDKTYALFRKPYLKVLMPIK